MGIYELIQFQTYLHTYCLSGTVLETRDLIGNEDKNICSYGHCILVWERLITNKRKKT
jgi:hypothetical protein